MVLYPLPCVVTCLENTGCEAVSDDTNLPVYYRLFYRKTMVSALSPPEDSRFILSYQGERSD